MGDYYLKLESKYFLCGCLNNELRVNLYVRVTSYYSLHELQVKFIIRITNYYLLQELGLQCRLCIVSLLDQLFVSMTFSLQNQIFLVRYS